MPTQIRQRKDAARKERTRSRLLDAAARVFARKGYHAALVSDIVAEADVGQGTFYRNFENKRGALEALYERLATALLAEFSPMSANLPDSLHAYREASSRLLRSLTSVLADNRDLVLLFLREASAVDHAFEQRVQQTYDRIADMARFYLEHAIAEGFARPCRADLVGQALVGIGLRMLNLWLGGRIEAVAAEALIEELVDFAFEGFGKEPDHE